MSVASQPLLSAQSGPLVLLYRATNASHSVDGISFTLAQSNPIVGIGVAVPDVSVSGLALSPVAVPDAVIFAAVGVAGADEPAPVPHDAKRVSDRRSAKESANNGVGKGWICLHISIFLS